MAASLPRTKLTCQSHRPCLSGERCARHLFPAVADVLAALWTYVASRILPIAAALAIMAAIWAFWQNRRWMHYVGAAGGFLTVAALWQLVRRLMT